MLPFQFRFLPRSCRMCWPTVITTQHCEHGDHQCIHSHCIVSYHVISHCMLCITSYHMTSYHIVSHDITSHGITSHHMTTIPRLVPQSQDDSFQPTAEAHQRGHDVQLHLVPAGVCRVQDHPVQVTGVQVPLPPR